MLPSQRCLAVASLLAAACGARTDALVGAPGDAARPDAAVADVPTADTPDGAPPDAPVPSACRWSARAPVALTAGDRDRHPQSVRVLDDRVWIAFQSSNPEPPGNLGWFVRLADASGVPVAPAAEVLPSPGDFVTYAGASLWTHATTRDHTAMAWDAARGCRVARLGDDARPRGVPGRVGTEDCSSVVATSSGWTYLTRGSMSGGQPYTRLRVVDVAGREVSSRSLVREGANVPAATRVVFADRTFLFAWVDRGPSTDVIHAAHYDAIGNPLAAARSRPTLRAPRVAALRLVDDGATALLGWTEVDAPGATAGDIVIERVDRSGAPRGSAAVPQRAMGRPQDWSLTTTLGRAAILWHPTTDTAGGLRFAALDGATLALEGAPVDVPTARFPRELFLRGTSRGAVAVYAAITRDALTQVWTAALECAPR